MSEQQENEARVLEFADLMMNQLLELRETLDEIETKLYPYYRIITGLAGDYKEAKDKARGENV